MNDLPLDHQKGANHPPEDIEEIVNTLVANTDKWAERGAIDSDEVSTLAVRELNTLKSRWAKYDALRAQEKKVHDDRAKAVQVKWSSPLTRIKACIVILDRLCRDYRDRKEQQRLANEAGKQREAAEAQRRADQLSEEALAGGPVAEAATKLIMAAEAAQEAERKRQELAAMPRRTQLRDDLGGRPYSPPTLWECAINNQDLFYRHVSHRQEVKDALLSVANADVRAKDGPRPEVWKDGRWVPNPSATEGTSQRLPGCLIFRKQS